ncbi:MAG: response regulator [Candidatus Nitronauta litoralis]|uniref:Response regulator n=1 Tax=Candidatus Nitronauta litoralis TaxID=2705533 RepID=A0A7T0BUH9_9BACT|nr:MAG: response regulator [Candidatus Nitronauta litoralis]
METPKILLVDDELKICSTLKKILESDNYTVETAYNGLDGWEKFRKFSPDCVLLDMRLPGRNGFELLKQIKSLRPKIHVLVTTAVIDESIMSLCMRAGARDYLVKPLNIPKLLEKVHHLLDDPLNQKSLPA